jgi:hypothetical protein
MEAKRFTAVLSLCIISSLLAGCGSAGETAAEEETTLVLDCPFTDMGWNSTIEDVVSTEGEDYTTYDSVYGGICYTYPKKYTGYEGTIKYMFDDEDQLMCVAWAYGDDDADTLYSLYETINSDLFSRYGDSGYNANGTGNYGNVWYLESGDIVLSTMVTTDTSALQYSYLHPNVSKDTSEEDS